MRSREDSRSSFSRKRLLVACEAAFEHGLLVIRVYRDDAAAEVVVVLG